MIGCNCKNLRLAVISRSFSLTSLQRQTFYDVLGLNSMASSAEIKKKYYELCRKYHPDKNQSDPTLHKQFVKISEAYDTLGNPNKRREYDSKLSGRYYSSQNDIYERYKSNARPYYNHDRNGPRSSKYYKQRAEYYRKYHQDKTDGYGSANFEEWVNAQNEFRERYRRHEQWKNQKQQWDENLRKAGFNFNQYDENSRLNAYWDSYYKNRKTGFIYPYHFRYNSKNVRTLYLLFCAFLFFTALRLHLSYLIDYHNTYRYENDNYVRSSRLTNNINSIREKLKETNNANSDDSLEK